MPTNGYQGDNSTKERVQDHWVQQPVGSNHKHHCVLHKAQLVACVTMQLRHRDKQCQENDGGWSTNMVEKNVYRKPDGCIGEQDSCAADMGSTPDLLHQKLAGMQKILRNKGKTIVF
jgi:hypothetical protein